MFRRFARVLYKYKLPSNAALAVESVSYRPNDHKIALGSVLLSGVIVGMMTNIDHQKAECEFNIHHKRGESLMLGRNFVADVVEQVSPAVVNIVCISAGLMSAGASTGSGFIINKDGYIATNAHVVASAADGRVMVTLSSGKRKAGKVHSMDLLSDIAIVKLDDLLEDSIPIVSFGDSSKVRSGEFVVAIGSPMHLQNSASLGIISATARHASELGISNNRSEYIQTDAAINMGNSGGPLVNLDGQVIGINTMKVKGTDGISFAIPIDIAAQVINQLLTTGKVTRPYVGLKMANMIATPQEYSPHKTYHRKQTNKMDQLLSSEDTQVVVLEVAKGSPAQVSGIVSGDVIMEVNGKAVLGVKDVLSAIGLEVGRVIELKIQRNQDMLTMTLTTAPEINKRK